MNNKTIVLALLSLIILSGTVSAGYEVRLGENITIANLFYGAGANLNTLTPTQGVCTDANKNLISCAIGGGSDNTKMDKTGSHWDGVYNTTNNSLKMEVIDDLDNYNYYWAWWATDPVSLYSSYRIQSADAHYQSIMDDIGVTLTHIEQTNSYVEMGHDGAGKSIRVDGNGYKFVGQTTTNKAACTTSSGYLSYCSGVTQNVTVLTALPSTFTTLQFRNGLLISVT